MVAVCLLLRLRGDDARAARADDAARGPTDLEHAAAGHTPQIDPGPERARGPRRLGRRGSAHWAVSLARAGSLPRSASATLTATCRITVLRLGPDGSIPTLTGCSSAQAGRAHARLARRLLRSAACRALAVLQSLLTSLATAFDLLASLAHSIPPVPSLSSCSGSCIARRVSAMRRLMMRRYARVRCWAFTSRSPTSARTPPEAPLSP